MFIQKNLRNVVDVLKAEDRKLFQGLIFFQSPGHMISEFDAIARIVNQDEKYRQLPPLVSFAETEQTRLIAKILDYAKLPISALKTPYAFQIQREIALFYPELTIRCASWDFRAKEGRKPNHEDNLYFLHVDEKGEYHTWAKIWIELCRDTLSLNVWRQYYEEVMLREATNQEFIDFLEEKPYFCIQSKYSNNPSVWNGSAQRVDPQDFDLTLQYIKDLGLRIILLGREDLPPGFDKYDVYHYPSSKYCSFESDFLLAGKAKAALISASGVGHLYDVLRTPTVSVNHWFPDPMRYANYRTLPARLMDTSENRVLNFREQMAAYDKIVLPQASVFVNQNRYKALRTAPEMVREAVKELLEPTVEDELKSEINRLKAGQNDPTGLWGKTDARLPACISSFYEGYL